jgi:hypothetical protein
MSFREAIMQRTERTAPQLRVLENVVAVIDTCIDKVVAVELHETAALLRIARLDLIVRLHGITDAELDQLESVVDRRQRGVERIFPKRLRRHPRDRQGARRTATNA